jgi:hypothetical protein
MKPNLWEGDSYILDREFSNRFKKNNLSLLLIERLYDQDNQGLQSGFYFVCNFAA